MNITANATVTGTKTTATGGASTVARQSSQNPLLNQLETSIQRDATSISLIGHLSSLLSQVQDKAKSLSTNGLATGVTVSEGTAQAHLTAGQALPGTYTFQVKQIAQAQELLSAPVTNMSSPVSAGGKAVIRIDIGAAGTKQQTSKLITIDQSNNTLEGIANALKASGVQAGIVQGSDGFQLRIESESGSANAMHIQVSGDTGLQTILSWPASNASGMKQVIAAQDAIVSVGGKSVTTPENTLDGAVSGVKLNFEATGTVKVVVTQDSSTVSANAKAFVDVVNKLSAQIDSLKTSDGASTRLAIQIKKQFDQSMSAVDQSALGAIGISVHGTTLTIDTKKFDAAAAAAPEKIEASLTGGKGGLLGAITDAVSKELSSSGVVATALSSTQQDMAHLTLQKATLTDSLNRQAALLAQKYTDASQGTYSQFGSASTYHKMSLFDYI